MTYGTVNVETVTTSTSGGILGAGNASIMKNRIINGAMLVSQRYGTTSTAGIAGNNYYIDQFMVYVNGGATYTVQQSATAPTGFTKSLLFTTSSGTASGSTSRAQIQHNIEGLNCTDLAWGTANAKTVTLSFWVQSSKTGQFGGALQNSAGNGSYPFSYTITSANTWQQISVTVPGPSIGTWPTDNSVCILVMLDLGMGSALQGTAGTWANADYRGATGDTSIVATTGATFYVTGIQLEVGPNATGFEYRQYGQEMALCQRYYYKANHDGGTAKLGMIYNSTLNRAVVQYDLPAKMRTAPTATYTIGLGTANSEYLTVDYVQIYLTIITNGYLNSFAASAEL